MNEAERRALADELARLAATVRLDEPLANHTTWKIGGPAELMVQPRTRGALVETVRLARSAGCPLRVMGNGSNLLCPDEGVRGVVLNPTNALAAITFDGATVAAEAGAFLPKLAREAASHGLSGLECVVGVPGTIGGGCVLNAGIPAGTLGEVLVDVEVLTEAGEVRTVPRDELAFAHRESRLQHEPWIVLSARLALREGDATTIQAAMSEHLAYRKRTQPLSEPTCGSVFRRPERGYPGQWIEQAGCKGLRCGGAEVSTLHANWIVNRGGATAHDVRTLMAEVRERVRADSGIELVAEVIVWEP